MSADLTAITALPAASFSAAAAISSLTFIDGLLLVGLVINGWGAFAACVYASANGLLGIPALILASFPGVYAGEQRSFWIARRAGASVLASGRRFAGWCERIKARSRLAVLVLPLTAEGWDGMIQKASRNVDRWGGAYLIVCRWTPIASLVPATCALSKMRYRRFAIYSLTSCLLWASLWNCIVFATVEGYLSI